MLIAVMMRANSAIQYGNLHHNPFESLSKYLMGSRLNIFGMKNSNPKQKCEI